MTGMALASYLLRVAKDVVARSPRFRRALGDVSLSSSNQIGFGNVQILVRDVTSDGARQSPDYFICTTTGRAILTQIEDKDGTFIEWLAETDATRATPAAGVYYFNVDSVDEGSSEVGLTMEAYKWYEGRIHNAAGTRIGLAPGINGTSLTVSDPSQPDVGVSVQAATDHLYLLSTVGSLLIKDELGNPLAPMTQFWVEASKTEVLLASTVFGVQTASIPADYITFSLVDQDGFTLRPNQDYTFLSAKQVRLSPWTPSGGTISVQGTIKLDPTVAANLLATENILPLTLQPGETLVPSQVFVSTQEGSHIQVTPKDDGTIVLPAPLPPGGWCTYEVRVLVGQSQLTTHKNAVNKDILPGLRIAIGDQVVVGDQCAIIISPSVTETYRVYGGKPAINFSLEVKANDPTTSDELAKALMRELLYNRRDILESDGLSLFEASSSLTSGSRDDSGTALTYSTTLSFSAAADWRVFEPLVTRITSFNVTTTPNNDTFRGRLVAAQRFHSLQTSGFIPNYG